MDGSTVVHVTPPCAECGERTHLALESVKYLRWKNQGALVQEVWPTWTADERELLLTGTHASCWDNMFKDLPEDQR